MRRLLAVVVVLCSVALAAGCDIRTATAPKGDLSLWADFDDVQDLSRGNYVEISNVVVGSVGSLELHGDRARARLDIDNRPLPIGTRAVVRRTSLLGEHFVELVPPTTTTAPGDELLQSGAVISDTSSQLEIEDLAARAEAILGSVDASGLSDTIAAADTAVGGRGQQLNVLIAQTSDVITSLHDQQDALNGAIDGFATTAASFAPRAADLAVLIDSIDSATRTVATNRDRAVASAESIVQALRSLDHDVLEPHSDRLVALLAQANPVLAAIAARSSSIGKLFGDIVFFNRVFPDVAANGQVLIQAWLDPTVLSGGNLNLSDPAGFVIRLLNGLV